MKREKRVATSLSAAQHRALRLAAAQAEMTVSAYVRLLIARALEGVKA